MPIHRLEKKGRDNVLDGSSLGLWQSRAAIPEALREWPLFPERLAYYKDSILLIPAVTGEHPSLVPPGTQKRGECGRRDRGNEGKCV